MARAKRTGHRILVRSQLGEARDVYANPDGTFTAELRTDPVRVRRGGGWVPINTSLQGCSDISSVGRSTTSTARTTNRCDHPGWRPVATTRSVVFSGGGEQPLVRLGHGGREIALRWPGRLPAPVVSGDTATYREVLRGVDLRLRATAQGFSKVLVVKNQAALTDRRLTELRFGLSTEGLTPRSDSSGNMTFVRTGTREVEFGTGAPMAWDSAGKRAIGTVRLDQRSLTVVPNRDLLTDPHIRFPIFIDPPFQPSRTGFALVYSGYPNNAYWGGDGESLGKVGQCWNGRGECNGIGAARSYFMFDASFLAGKHILSANFDAFLAWSPSCSARGVSAWGTNPVGSGTTWNNQPFPGGGPTNLGSWNVAAGHDANCPARSFGWGGADDDIYDDETDPPWIRMMKNALAFNNGIVTVLLKADNEGDQLGWKKFAVNGQTPYLVTTYNSYPNAPYNRKTENKSCGQEVFVNPHVDNDPNKPLRGPQMSSSISDPDGGLVHGQFELYARSGSKLWTTPADSVPEVSSGSTVKADIPARYAVDGAKLSWRIRGADGTDYGPFGSFCDVTIDRTAPGSPPTVRSDGYPECAPPDYDPCPRAGGIGRTGAFVFGRNDVADVAGYRYDLHDQPSTYVAADAQGNATALVTPPNDNPMDLYVRSVDKAGNVGPIYRYHFLVGAGTPPAALWRLEGLDETVVRDDSGHRHNGSTVMGPTTWREGRHGDALWMNGFNGYASTSDGQVVHTNQSFAVAAWVKLEKTDNGFYTAVSQDGNVISSFFLQYRGDSKKWVFLLPNSDCQECSTGQAVSNSPAKAGVWTHLVGTYDQAAGVQKLYVNGVLQGTASHGAHWDSSGNVQLGRGKFQSTYVDYWPGSLDEVRLYDRTLSIEEIRSLATLPATEEVFYGFDEGEGTSAGDVAGSYRTGTISGGASWSAGKVGPGALHFDGTGEVRSTGPVVRTDSSFTVTARAKLDYLAQGTVVSQDGNRGSGFHLQYRPDTGKWTFLMLDKDADSPSAALVNSSATPAVGEWVHLAGVYDEAAGKIRIYVNGALGGEVTRTVSGWHANGSFVVGASKYNGQLNDRFWGSIDDVHVWTGVRTQDQIKAEIRAEPTERVTAYTGQLSRFWNYRGFHVITTGPVPPGSHFEGSLGRMAPTGATGTRPIYSCRSGDSDYFLSLLADCEGRTRLGRLGELYESAQLDTVAIYRCKISPTGPHFASGDPKCEGRTVDGLLGYAPGYVNLIRSVRPSPADHISSTYRVPADYKTEGVFGVVAINPQPGTTALYLCRNGEDTFSSTDSACEGKAVVAWLGQIWTSPPENMHATVEVFRCIENGNHEFFDSLDPACEGQTFDRSLGFVVTAL